jgi:DNA-binding response OmpR family regulator
VSDGRPEFDTRLYFGRVIVLLIEGNSLEAEIVSQIFIGFKVRQINRFETAAQGRSFLERERADIIVVGTSSPAVDGMDEFDFVRWLRRTKDDVIQQAPVILLAGHTSEANVFRARDCGASFVIAKPITPQILFDRVVWLARDVRAFIDTEGYAGPDRRFQKLGPPPNMEGRRKDDLSLRIGAAKEPNMSQNEIDALLNGRGALR